VIRQRGVALVTAMLLMVIGVTLAAQIAWDNQLHVRRAILAADMEQARLFAMGAEAIAIVALRADYEDYATATTRSTHEGADLLFGTQELPIGIEDQNLGVMYGKLEDLQGRFNLNNLVVDNGNRVSEEAAQVMRNLLSELALDESLVDAMVDWIDNDTVPENRGAEDGIYTGLSPSYRPPNRGFTHVSELRAVAGIGAEEYRKLKPYVTALPQNGCSIDGGGGQTATQALFVPAININFAQPELIRALNLDNQISPGTLEQLIQLTAESGIEEWQTVQISQAELTPLQNYVSLVTHCFGLTVYVTIGNSVLSMYSVLERTGTGKDIYVRQRIFGIEDAS
jgi:general secretion pathway protein K